MSNLALAPNLKTSISVPSIRNESGTGIGSFNPQRLNGIADILYVEAEQRKASVKSLHGAVLAHKAMTQQYVSVDERVFLVDLKTALKRVDVDFWKRLYDDTKLCNFMDTESYNARKNELNNHDSVIPFTIENIVNQLEMFCGEIDQVLIKRVVTIFEKLSGEHVTNSPYGFRNRMILDSCSRTYNEHSKSRYLHDLRCVIATMRGETDMPCTSATTAVLEHCFTYTGKWHMLDGDTMRMKAFKKGTVHIEIDSAIADKLNEILAAEYPNCLPLAGKKKALFKSTLKPVEIMLGNGVRNELRRISFEHPLKKRSERRDDYYRDTNEHEIRLYCWSSKNNPALIEAVNLLSELYGEPKETDAEFKWELGSHDPKATIKHLVVSGTVPEEVSHQFYESTDRVQELVDTLLDINDNDDICEPSAGRGALAKLLPKSQTTCFEINALNCSILSGLGYDLRQECFLQYANKTSDRYDLFVMNPPYTNGMYWAHLKAAMSLLKPGGRIVAVVPCSVTSKKSELPSDITMTENYRIKEQFKGTSQLHISIITLEKSSVF